MQRQAALRLARTEKRFKIVLRKKSYALAVRLLLWGDANLIELPRWLGILVSVLLSLLVACASSNDRSAPTATAALPVIGAAATQSPVPPPIVSERQAQPTIFPTIEAEITPTTPALDSPAPLATAAPFQIVRPVDGSVIIAGNKLTINGWARPQALGVVTLSIKIGYQDILTEQVAVDASGMWGGLFTLPANVTGPATLIAASPVGERAIVALEVVADSKKEGPMIVLGRPMPGDAVATGHVVFFEGLIREPVNETMSFSVLANNCTTPAAHFTMAMSDGVWWGQLILPENTSTGPACAMASTGQVSAADGNWREVRVPITLLDPEDPGAARLFLGNPGQLIFQAGANVRLYGGAVNAPENQVRLVLTQDTIGQGAVLAEATASVEAFGYWEAELSLPVDWSGPALLTASMGADENYIELRVVAEVER